MIEGVAKSDWFKRACKTIGKNNSDDLQQEFLLFMCSKDEEYLTKIEPYLKWWAISTLTRIAHPANERKQYNKLYNPKHDSLNFDIVQEHDVNFNDELKAARDKVLKEIYWFDAKIFELYESGMPYSRIYRQTNIHHKTIKDSINNTIELIKKEYERNIADNINVLFNGDCG